MSCWPTRSTAALLAPAITLLLFFGVRSAGAQTISVVSSPHDLSAGSTGRVRAASEDQVCVFCHTPHNASPVGALWNRSLSSQAYSVYTSASLNATPGQPTGSSKLCLSCHDGTIALGRVLSSDQPLQMSGGVTNMPAGHANLGTDLRDDHPISFRFDSSLVSKDLHLRDPGALPRQIKLDSNRELQCTSCHDAHNNAFGQFLVMRNTNSELCMSCHQVGRTDISGHAQCIDCHQSHTAPSGPYLLKRLTVSETCLSCHDGRTSNAPNIAGDMRKSVVHDTGSGVDSPESPISISTCTSCHEPHSMMRGLARTSMQGPSPASHGRLGRIAGVNASGAPVRQASSEQEVCYKCHAEGNKLPQSIARKAPQNNVRLQFAPNAISLHPVGTPGRAVQTPSLKPGWNTASTMRCSDCHGSDSGEPAGVHGSNVPGLLVARYETTDRTSESAANYALCYKCHERSSILNNQSFPGHSLHVQDQRTPCSACHDAHGIPSSQGTFSGNSHLINFASSIVLPDRVTGKLEYRDAGGFTGQCFLSCHGVDHSPKSYPTTGTGLRGVPARRGNR